MGVALAVAIGGAIGSLLRYLVSKAVQGKVGVDFPLGTMVVNLVGAFLIGFAFSYLVERLTVSPEVRALLITGLLGGLTTFSTFSYESFNLLFNGEGVKFILYVAGTNLIGITMTMLGYNLGRLL